MTNYNYFENTKCNCENLTKACMDKCGKYTAIYNRKCEEATEINNKANHFAMKANAVEQEAKKLQDQANVAYCEAIRLWQLFNQLTEKSTQLLKDAQYALEEGMQGQKKYLNNNMLNDNRVYCCNCKLCCNCSKYNLKK